jgi:hypothetical protein
VRRTGWQPQRIARFGGAIAYRRYNPLLRFVMRRIAAHQGLSVDSSRDHEYTDWNAVDALGREIAVRCAAAVTGAHHEPDAKGAVEEDVRRILAIDSLDSLGYHGEGREEHSGENPPRDFESLEEELADNRAGEAVPSGR